MRWWLRSNFAALVVVLLTLGAGARADGVTTLKVAYIPIMPMSQLFVIDGEGWAADAGIELELTKFSSGPAIVQAIASGDFDVMYFGIGPAMVSRANGVPIKVVASNVVEQIALIGRGRFAEIMAAAASPADGLRAFKAETGAVPKIATLPRGSVPDTVLRHWLLKVAGLAEDEVEIIGMGAGKVQQAMLTRAVDGASILEPVVTIIDERLDDTFVVAAGGTMLENQPGAVVAVREQLIEAHGDAVQALVELHLRATTLINEEPDRAAQHIHAALGQGLVPETTIKAALRSPISNFVDDPRAIVPATRVMHDFSAEIGTLKKPVPLDELFDVRFYEAAVERQ